MKWKKVTNPPDWGRSFWNGKFWEQPYIGLNIFCCSLFVWLIMCWIDIKELLGSGNTLCCWVFWGFLVSGRGFLFFFFLNYSTHCLSNINAFWRTQWNDSSISNLGPEYSLTVCNKLNFTTSFSDAILYPCLCHAREGLVHTQLYSLL